MIRKLFFGYEMTWKRLILFSVLIGVYTGLVMVPSFLKDTAFQEIGIGYSMWFVLAIIVVSNCKSTPDAGIKCFVFFLISQPLVYLTEDLFFHENLLMRYYYPWFIKTLFTFPGGMIAYQIKRKDLFGTLILAFAGLSMSVMGIYFFIESFYDIHFTYGIYGILLIGIAIFLSFLYCEKKKDRILYCVLVLGVTLVFGTIQYIDHQTSGSYEYPLNEEGWSVSSAGFDDMTVDVKGDVLLIEYSAYQAKGNITLENENGEERKLVITVRNKEVIVEE